MITRALAGLESEEVGVAVDVLEAALRELELMNKCAVRTDDHSIGALRHQIILTRLTLGLDSVREGGVGVLRGGHRVLILMIHVIILFQVHHFIGGRGRGRGFVCGVRPVRWLR